MCMWCGDVCSKLRVNAVRVVTLQSNNTEPVCWQGRYALITLYHAKLGIRQVFAVRLTCKAECCSSEGLQVWHTRICSLRGPLKASYLSNFKLQIIASMQVISTSRNSRNCCPVAATRTRCCRHRLKVQAYKSSAAGVRCITPSSDMHETDAAVKTLGQVC